MASLPQAACLAGVQGLAAFRANEGGWVKRSAVLLACLLARSDSERLHRRRAQLFNMSMRGSGS